MTLASLVVVFVITWWCVFFMALPWGNRAPEESGEGFAESAPERPRLWIKAAVTTAIALVITWGIHYVVIHDLISFREMVAQ